jgi:predicted transcriptional regulator
VRAFDKRKKNRRWKGVSSGGSTSNGDPANRQLAITASLVAAYVQNSALPLNELRMLIISIHFCVWAPGASPRQTAAEVRKLAHLESLYRRSVG